MPGRPDFTKLVTIYTKVCGGEPAPGQTLGAQLGPLGVNGKAVNQSVVSLGNEWKGIRIMIRVDCQNRQGTVTIKDTTGAQLIKAAGNYQRDRKKTKLENRSGDISMEEIKRIGTWLHNEGGSMSRELQGSVLQVLGTAKAIGYTIDGQNATDVSNQIKSGEIRI